MFGRTEDPKQELVERTSLDILIGLIFTIVGFGLALKADRSLNSGIGTVCESKTLEDVIRVYVIVEGFLFVHGLISLYRVNQISTGKAEIENSIAGPSIWPPGVIGQFMNLLGTAVFVYRVVWYIIFVVAYRDEFDDCVDFEVANVAFDKGEGAIKALLIFESIRFAIVCFAMFCCCCVCCSAGAIIAGTKK